MYEIVLVTLEEKVETFEVFFYVRHFAAESVGLSHAPERKRIEPAIVGEGRERVVRPKDGHLRDTYECQNSENLDQCKFEVEEVFYSSAIKI